MKKLVLPALLCLACQPPIFFECSHSVLREAESPDGRYSATFFERDCGATTAYSSLVSLHESRRQFDPEHAEIVFAVDGRSDIKIYWTSNRSLSIDPGDGEVVRHVDSWKDIQISVNER